jgi:3-deoxy-D-manno-octulosonate 8-phosphate phosphatase (KDO 8-P phosphatase)
MEELFKQAGGEFVTSYSDIAEKHKLIKAYVFDWDGVFNTGVKGEGISSPYYEADSMGINMLRFAYWLRQRDFAMTSIITGEQNSSAFQFAHREHFQSVYYSVKNKINALHHIRQTYGISPEQIAYIFDDILDLPVAEQCGLRFLVRRKGSPMFADYARKKNLCDYITGSTGGDFAVREVAELLLGVSGDYSNTIEERISFGFNYETYLNQRDSVSPVFFTFENGKIVKKRLANN